MKSRFLTAIFASTLWLLSGSQLWGGEWTIEAVDALGAAVKYTSMKIDTMGNVHLAYVVDDSNREPLRYAFWDRSLAKWFTMTVDQNVGTCSLALDSLQRPHIAYTDFAGGRLRYAKWDGVKWHTEVIPLNSQNINYYQSIAITPNDHPAIAFYEYEGPKGTDYRIRLRTVMWDGERWMLRTVDSDPGSGKFNAMLVDQRGNLHLAYANVSASTGGMRYARWDGQNWKIEILEGEKENNGHGVGWSCNIALDKDANPYLTYMDEVEGYVKFAVRRDGKWQIRVMDQVRGVAYPDRNSIVIDGNGITYVGYFDSALGVLRVARQEGSKWMVETVDDGNSGFTSSMQIDRGMLWISYADGRGGGLKVAHQKLSGAAKPVPAVSAESKK